MHTFWTNPTNQKKLLYAGAACLILLGSYTLYSQITKQPPVVKSIPLVRTITVGEMAGATASIYPGEVRGRYESQLAFQVAGKINARLVNVGDRVTAGQVLLTLDPKDVNQSVESSTAQLASAQANFKLAADNAQRYNTLYSQGAVSEAIRDQYNTQLEAASATLRQAQAQANISTHQLGYTQLVSDVDGVISAINGEAGQIVAAGTPMATVVRAGEREVQINVPEGAPVRVGQQAKISFWALDGVTATGQVREIAPMADSITRTYKVCVAVPDLPQAAKLGMTAKVELLKESIVSQSAHFVLPTAALYQVNNKTQVWLVQENKAQLVDVTIAGYNGNNVIITQGLKNGDRVITAGLTKLTPNQEVRLEDAPRDANATKGGE